ncbi:putative reticulocyte-binding protein 2 like protein a protein [Diplogelasinospora grovesii]|uniref:Reticulocyte-binding protein 2 like protein a protein n=1 Tax=Diplogelasinospora grovesii TaxID=303347 RepID=A0AAN6N3S5_9PEZI|nr:putative reticulocyte-binding protein 2 like protein a protein [Diplogelasinospora grovesii]
MAFSFHPKTTTASRTRQWDPEKLTSLVNPDTRDERCLGWAYSRRRQCQRSVAWSRIRRARQSLDSLSYLDPMTAAKSPELLVIAQDMLCYQHLQDDEDIVERWETSLRKYAAEDERRKKREEKDEKLKREQERKAEETKRQWEEIKRLLKEIKREAEERQRQQQKAEEERKQKEEQEEREREQERERKRQEDQRREEELRQRARKTAQEREKAAKKEWADAWTRYCAGWEAIEKNREQICPIDKIPWPTKSGRRDDVSQASVRQFFDKALPVHLSSTPGEERFRMISLENKRWHTDKILSRFGQDVLRHGKPCANALDLIAKLMVELRKEAKMRREE